MKVSMVMLLFILLFSPEIFAREPETGRAYLMFCEIEDTTGNVMTGLLHVATQYTAHDRINTNGLLFVNYKDKGKNKSRPFYIKISFGKKRYFERENCVYWSGIAGWPREYILPGNILWYPDTEVYYLIDTTLSCEATQARHAYSFSIDTLGNQNSCKYKYTLIDNYELCDYIPLFTEIPDSFSCNRFYGGNRERIQIDKINSIKLLSNVTSKQLIYTLYEWYSMQVEPEDFKNGGIGFKIIFGVSEYYKIVDGKFKPSFYSE